MFRKTISTRLSNMLDVSIIIVNYNTRNLVLNCINSVYEKTEGISFEIIVVDNASADDSVKAIKENFPEVTVIESKENLGFGRANNLGAEKAKGEFIFLLNSDTLLINNAVNILFNYMKNNPNVGISGGNLYNEDKEISNSHMMLMPGLFHELNTLMCGIPSRIRHKNRRIYNPTNLPIEVAYITGADLMISKSLFTALKGFDSNYFMYYEETDLELRVKKEGFKIMNFPSAKIIHLEGKSFLVREHQIRQILKSRKYYLVKNHGTLYYYCCNIIYFLSSLSFSMIYHFTNKTKSFYWKTKLKMLFSF